MYILTCLKSKLIYIWIETFRYYSLFEFVEISIILSKIVLKFKERYNQLFLAVILYMNIGISLFGLDIPGMYDNENTFINVLDRLIEFSNFFEIPLLPLTWIPKIVKYKKEKRIRFYSVHMPKNFFAFTVGNQLLLLRQAKIIIDKLDVTTIVFHPSNKYSNEQLINFTSVLIKNNKQVSFELCDKALLNKSNMNFDHSKYKILLDYAHLKRMNILFENLDFNNISHIHLRGYRKDLRYSRIIDSFDNVKKFINILKSKEFKKSIILEYPYNNLEDIKDDYRLLNSIL